MTSNAMKNIGFTPNEELAQFQAQANQRRKKAEHEKKKGITIFNSNLSYIDNLRYNLIDNIYLITSKATSFQRLSTIHVLLGHSKNIEQILDLLGCYSLNDFIRQNRQYFNEFLEIFVTKTEKKSTSTNSQLVLYYFNKKIHQHPILKKSMKEAFEEEAFEHRQEKRFRITFDETKYFEFHNSLEFIDGRKEFAKVVAECQRRMLINKNGYVPVNKFTLIFKELFNDNDAYNSRMKAWFPTCSGMENIMRKIIFKDISFSYSCPNTKKEAELRIKDGCTFEEICQNLNLLKNDITTFYEKIYRDFGIIKDNELPKKRTPINKYIIPTAEKKKKIGFGCFDDSDEEADLRVENSKFVAPDYRGKKDGNIVATIKKKPTAKKFETEKMKEFFDFAEKYRLLPDSDLDEYDLEIKEIDVGHGIIKEALKKAIENSKPANDDLKKAIEKLKSKNDDVEKNDDSIKVHEYIDSSDSDY